MDEENLNSALRSVPTLRDLSVIAAASLLCQYLNIKDQLEEYLDKRHPVWRTKTPHDQYTELIRKKYLKQLLQEISSIFWKMLNRWNIPRILKLEVHDRALEITERIHNWMLHLICDLELTGRYIKIIYFTAQGEIDQDKIFKNQWMNFPFDRPTKRSFLNRRITILHYLACAFFQEEYVITNQANIMEEINSLKCCSQQVDNDPVFTIMKHVIHNLGKYNSSAIIDLPELMEICTLLGLYKPFIFFWNQCNESQKLNYLDKMSSYESWIAIRFNLKAHYAADNLFKIVTFLMDLMNESQRNELVATFAENFYFVPGRSECWTNFFIRIVDRYLPTISKSEVEPTFLYQVFKTFNVSLLKTVICHKIYKRRKYYVLHFGQEKYKELILKNNFYSLDELLDNVFKTEHEKNHFKKEFNFLQEFVSSDRWEKVKEVLNWMGTLSKSDKRNLIIEELKNSSSRKKREIEKLLKIFLKWYSGTVKTPLINNCEDLTSLKDLTREIIYILWFRFYSRFPVANISSEILQSVFHIRKEIRIFKKTKLAKDEVYMVKLFCEMKLELKEGSEACFSDFEKFLKFCRGAKKMDRVKTLIADNIGDWILQYGVNLRRFDILVPLLDWVYESKNDNRELLKNYFENSDEIENYYQNRKI